MKLSEIIKLRTEHSKKIIKRKVELAFEAVVNKSTEIAIDEEINRLLSFDYNYLKLKLDNQSPKWILNEYLDRLEELSETTIVEFPATYSDAIEAFRTALYNYTAGRIEAEVFAAIETTKGS